jgi:lysophospholipase L1-like esterase
MAALQYYGIRACLAVSLVVALGAGPELVVRLGYRLQNGSWPLSLAAVIRRGSAEQNVLFAKHSILPFTLRPGARLQFADTWAEVNSCGFRGPELRPTTPLRILVVGGSTTFDTGVTDDDATWCRQLEKRLQATFPGVEVINGGLPVYATWSNCFKYILYDYQVRPDAVLIYQGLNDTLRWWPAVFGELPFTDYWQYRGCHGRGYSDQVGEQALPLSPTVLDLTAHSILLRGAYNERGRNENLFANMCQAQNALACVPDSVLAKNNDMLARFLEAITGTGALPIVVPQGIGARTRHPIGAAHFEVWVDGLRRQAEAYVGCARQQGVKAVDLQDSTFAWGDEYFKDSMHFNDAGARALAQLLAPVLSADEDLKRIYSANTGRDRSRPTHILDRVIVPDENVKGATGQHIR